MASRLPPVSRVVAFALASSIAIALGASCDRNIEPYAPGEEAKPPDLARMFPEPDAAPGGADSEPVMPAAPAPERGSAAAVEPATASGAPIRGRIAVAQALVGSEPARPTLFVIARRDGAAGGPPLAVLRIPAAELPLDFEIGPQHAMIAGMPFAGPIRLSARLDADGDAMTRSPGDLQAELPTAVEPGATGVQLVLDAKL